MLKIFTQIYHFLIRRTFLKVLISLVVLLTGLYALVNSGFYASGWEGLMIDISNALGGVSQGSDQYLKSILDNLFSSQNLAIFIVISLMYFSLLFYMLKSFRNTLIALLGLLVTVGNAVWIASIQNNGLNVDAVWFSLITANITAAPILFISFWIRLGKTEEILEFSVTPFLTSTAVMAIVLMLFMQESGILINQIILINIWMLLISVLMGLIILPLWLCKEKETRNKNKVRTSFEKYIVGTIVLVTIVLLFFIRKEAFAIDTTSFVGFEFNNFPALLWSIMIVYAVVQLMANGRLEIALIKFLAMIPGIVWVFAVASIFSIPFDVFLMFFVFLVFALSVFMGSAVGSRVLINYKYTGIAKSGDQKSTIVYAITASFCIVLVGLGSPGVELASVLTGVSGLLLAYYSSVLLIPLFFNWLVRSNGKSRIVPLTFKDFFWSVHTFILFLAGVIYQTILGILFFGIIPNRNPKLKKIYHVSFMWVCKYMIYGVFSVRKKIINAHQEKFKEPAVIISNHQSHIDVLLILMLTPKVIVLINDWVKSNPFYGLMIRFADFYPVSEGYENSLEPLSQKVAQGYSILVFPEGSRSSDGEIKRFHRGAFYLADKLNLEIVPVLLHGVNDVITKGEPVLKTGRVIVKIFERINTREELFGETYKEKARRMRAFYKKERNGFKEVFDTPDYYNKRLIRNYIYKGPVLEWYMRVKVKMEDNYSLFHKLVPASGVITDIGCGYGFLTYMLSYLSDSRHVNGMDYDEDKISVACACIDKANSVSFFAGDAVSTELEPSDAFIINDVLHYMTEEEQEEVVEKCCRLLNENGILIIRDGNSESVKHVGTKYTEVWSTKLLAFNKTRNSLHFTSRSKIAELAQKNGMEMKVYDDTVFTSNEVYILKPARNTTETIM